MDNMFMLMSVEKKVGSDKLYLLQNKAEKLDTGKVSYAIATSNMKDPLITLLLGIFVGGVGAHRFYMGEKKKGAAFATCFALTFLLVIGLSVAMTAVAINMSDYNAVIDSDLNIIYGLTVGLIISSLLMCVVALVGLIDGFVSYTNVQKRNFEKLYNELDKLEKEKEEFDF